ncbi:MAG: hypothetical protein CMG46_03085 [Candidatus Marinimicrobia bacterium]|nr:hypothetical protein [Candidatus Neomarinimicrobiota bacterium]
MMTKEKEDNVNEESDGCSGYIGLFILGFIGGFIYFESISGAILSGIILSMIPFIIMLVFGIIAVYAAFIIVGLLFLSFLFDLF